MSVHRYKVVWTGFSGGPGYTTFHFHYPTEPGTAPTIATALSSWANDLRTIIPNVVTLTPSLSYDVLDEATGMLIDQKTDGGVATPRIGSSAGNFASYAGACATLRTAVVSGGRRVRGRQFLVPLSGGAFEADGTLWTTATPTILTAYSNLMSATSLAPLSVWKRPVSGAGGVLAEVSSVTVNDRGAVLTSRRD